MGYAKLKTQPKTAPDVLLLAELAMVTLNLEPLAYPQVTADLTGEQKQRLVELLASSEQVAKASKGSPRVIGQALLIKAKILASQRQFFAASQLLGRIVSDYQEKDRALAQKPLTSLGRSPRQRPIWSRPCAACATWRAFIPTNATWHGGQPRRRSL